MFSVIFTRVSVQRGLHVGLVSSHLIFRCLHFQKSQLAKEIGKLVTLTVSHPVRTFGYIFFFVRLRSAPSDWDDRPALERLRVPARLETWDVSDVSESLRWRAPVPTIRY